MATAIRSGKLAESPGEPFAWPALESFEEGLRDARRAALAARHAAEDFSAQTVLNVRKHPLRSVGIAFAAGAVMGGAIGVCAASCLRR